MRKRIQLVFRILDLDPPRLNAAELYLRRLVKSYRINASICLVNDFLELGRLGVADKLPALEVNGVIVSSSRELTGDLLEEICRTLIS